MKEEVKTDNIWGVAIVVGAILIGYWLWCKLTGQTAEFIEEEEE